MQLLRHGPIAPRATAIRRDCRAKIEAGTVAPGDRGPTEPGEEAHK
jgi:hypothetical protein